ncbi:hypothetical protein AWE51_07925 [Aquimarina aggregata]|uniref:Uncharacterized protein n=1 Tax=Aquimarina aggregata TaxID=1642818 RepID=A0A162Z5B7_9FLAO|nr:hypothetical protein [Aquimarina aggregata]KZS39573.1 hypothetical protein AWE51_07925 [Aquimarina aggregata]
MKLNLIVEAFNVGKLPKQGCISIYGNFFGKPGDTISSIKEISIDNNSLVFRLGDSKILSIESPEEISYDSNSIVISKSTSVKVDNEEYLPVGGKEALNLYNW